MNEVTVGVLSRNADELEKAIDDLTHRGVAFILASGADAFLTKPLDFSIVRDEIDMRIRHAA